MLGQQPLVHSQARGPVQEGTDQDSVLLPGLGIISLRVIGAPSLLSALAMYPPARGSSSDGDDPGTGADWHNNQMVLGVAAASTFPI